MEVFKYIFLVASACIGLGLLFIALDTISNTHKIDDDEEYE